MTTALIIAIAIGIIGLGAWQLNKFLDFKFENAGNFLTRFFVIISILLVLSVAGSYHLGIYWPWEKVQLFFSWFFKMASWFLGGIDIYSHKGWGITTGTLMAGLIMSPFILITVFKKRFFGFLFNVLFVYVFTCGRELPKELQPNFSLFSIKENVEVVEAKEEEKPAPPPKKEELPPEKEEAVEPKDVNPPPVDSIPTSFEDTAPEIPQELAEVEVLVLSWSEFQDKHPEFEIDYPKSTQALEWVLTQAGQKGSIDEALAYINKKGSLMSFFNRTQAEKVTEEVFQDLLRVQVPNKNFIIGDFFE